MVLCADSTHVWLVGSLRCQCGGAANGYPLESEKANSWSCPNDKNHTFRQPSGFCLCGQTRYKAPEKRVNVTFPPNVTVNPNPFSGYHPAGYRQPKPDPAPETSLAQLKAARDDVKATHLSADGKFAYTVRYGEVLQAEWDGSKYDSWWPVVGGKMPEDAVRL